MTAFSFDARETGFSLANALACARVSLLAYSNEQQVCTAAGEWGFAGTKCLVSGSNYFIVLRRPDMIVVAFRGTDDVRDFRTNFNILYKKSPLGFVHRGFMNAVNALWPELLRLLQEVRDSDQRLWFTGHSLGGALAVLASVKAHFENGLPVAGAYTFGQPPIGTTGFCSEFEKRCPYRLYRFISHTDAVADVPILTLIEHVGDVRYFDLSGKLWEGDPPWRVMMSDHWNAPRVDGGMADFKAHSMAGYIKLLEACRRPEPPTP